MEEKTQKVAFDGIIARKRSGLDDFCDFPYRKPQGMIKSSPLSLLTPSTATEKRDRMDTLVQLQEKALAGDAAAQKLLREVLEAVPASAQVAVEIGTALAGIRKADISREELFERLERISLCTAEMCRGFTELNERVDACLSKAG